MTGVQTCALPICALDPVIRASLQGEMKRIHRASGKTIVMVTHDIDEALLLATTIVLLDRGQVVQVASPLQLLTQPANDFVVDFLGRSDMGIKRLSLQRADALVRQQARQAGPSLRADSSLREAVSCLAMHHIESVNLDDGAGGHAGVLHAADIFSQLKLPDSKG